MIKEEYSPYKAAHHTDRLEKLRAGQTPAPVQMQIDLTNRCNHNCSYCTHRNPLKRKGTDFSEKDLISTERIIKLISEGKEIGVKAILLLGGGEPLIHPGIKEIVEHIENLSLEFALVTNGVLINKRNVKIFKNARWIRVSVDAATNETYQKVQKTKNSIPIKQIKLIRNTCKKAIIGISFLTKPENYHEAYMTAVMAKKLGVDNIRYSVVQTLDGKDILEPYYKEYFQMLEKTKELEDKKFKVFGLKDRREALKNQKDYETCLYQHFTAVIAANGKVYPCCWTKNFTHFNLGSIYKQSFSEIWFGKKRAKFIKNMNLKKCPPCWFDEANKFLSYLLKKDPKHVNFV
ncbi:MAG: radical SAM protein [Nanoarchaeota archaeon]|nr:radical SAM protein [Nanoarchaeota archaeon]MBU1030560.1 radical SAM protein [Nanoarchaeota archaeon]MBU1849483.1 radical SAM protein [Nanoarchaeota archaeon]